VHDNLVRLFTIKGVIILSIIMVLFVSTTYFSLFNLYPSPMVKQTNPEVTKSEFYGMDTFFTYRNQSIWVLEYLPSSFRYHDALYGESAKKINIGRYDPYSFPPDHFGYLNQNLSEYFYGESRYLLTDDRGRGFYSHVYPGEFTDLRRFLPEDFVQLNFDDKVQKIYSNRNLEVFVVS
jgi:hypothetical protein